jgi:hypothetical protein
MEDRCGPRSWNSFLPIETGIASELPKCGERGFRTGSVLPPEKYSGKQWSQATNELAQGMNCFLALENGKTRAPPIQMRAASDGMRMIEAQCRSTPGYPTGLTALP